MAAALGCLGTPSWQLHAPRVQQQGGLRGWQRVPSWHRRPQRTPLAPRAAAGGGEELDVAVFRFTLGIPGFDDALIPRVVAAVGAVALLANHFLSGTEPTEAQARAEALGTVLAAVGLATPSIEQLLKERQPGRGRLAVSEAVEGARSVFALSSGLSERAKQEAAWASFALLRNSNICGLVALWEGRAVMCRGLVGLPAGATGNADAVLQAVTQAFASSKSQLAQAYWTDRASIRAAGGDSVPSIPSGAQSALVQPIQPLGAAQAGGAGAAESSERQPRGWLLLISERPRALSASERAWAAAVAGKLWLALAKGAE